MLHSFFDPLLQQQQQQQQQQQHNNNNKTPASKTVGRPPPNPHPAFKNTSAYQRLKERLCSSENTSVWGEGAAPPPQAPSSFIYCAVLPNPFPAEYYLQGGFLQETVPRMKETTITNNNNNNNNNNKNNNNNSNRNKSWGTAAAPREHRKADAKVQKKGVHGCEIKETGSGV